MIEAHLLKLRRRDTISPEEEAAIRGAVSDVFKLSADQVFVHEGQELDVSTLLLDGWMARAKDLPSGERQLIELHFPGDFVDLHSFTLKRLDHDILTLTGCRVAAVSHQKLREITERYPHLTRVYWFLTNLDAAIHRERTLSLGKRSALSRTAHLFCELFIRLQIVELTRGDSYELPLKQAQLAEYLGVTTVHVNRMLQELRRRGIIRFEHHYLTILDQSALREVAEFDPSYLYLEPEPR